MARLGLEAKLFSIQPIYRLRSHPLQKFIGVSLLILLAVGMIGLPISAPAPAKDGRFPCEDCPCGCTTADFCWDKCCCHSDLEKLEWAAQNNVQPPEFLVARAASVSPTFTLVRTSSAKSSTSACCCCSKPSASTCDSPESPAQETTQATRSGLVRFEDAARCRGIELLWSLFSQVLVQQPQLCAVQADLRLLFCVAIQDDRHFSRAICPDPPVP